MIMNTWKRQLKVYWVKHTQNIALIVVNDGSTDPKVGQILDSYADKIIVHTF